MGLGPLGRRFLAVLRRGGSQSRAHCPYHEDLQGRSRGGVLSACANATAPVSAPGDSPGRSDRPDLQAEGLIATAPSARATRHQTQSGRVARKGCLKMKSPETEDRKPEAAVPSPTVASKTPESPRAEPRKSIFDPSYAPEGAELRRAWSRFDRKKQ